jgi:glucosamine-6-phosphate deaminase
VIAATPTASVVVATGRTPMGLYAELASRRRSGEFDPSAITPVQLDEYLDLEPGDGRSLFGWMRRSFLEPLGVGDDRVIRLPLDGDLNEACEAYDRSMEARGPLDLAILGLGPNGHLGFNEPPSDPESPTRVVDLSAATLEANRRYWDGSVVPSRAVTMGLHHLLRARTIVLLVSGTTKGTIVHRALEGPVEPDVPASFLQQAVGDVRVVVDRAAWGTA